MNDALKNTITGAIERTPVPEFDFSAISRRAAGTRVSRSLEARRGRWLAVLVFLVPGLALGAGILPSPQMRRAIMQAFHFERGVPITWHRSMQTSTANAFKGAAFSLRLPAGLPAGTRLAKLSENGNTGTSYTAEYVLPTGKHVTFSIDKVRPHPRYLPWIFRANVDDKTNAVGPVQKIPVRIWITGNEVVTVAVSAFKPAEMQSVERAMSGRDAPLVPLAKLPKPQR
jgi:hypothetical protein